MGLLIYRPTKLRPGDKKLPTKVFNDVIETVRALAAMSAGPGLKLSKSKVGFVLTLTDSPKKTAGQLEIYVAPGTIPPRSACNWLWMALVQVTKTPTGLGLEENFMGEDTFKTVDVGVWKLAANGFDETTGRAVSWAKIKGPFYNDSHVEIVRGTRLYVQTTDDLDKRRVITQAFLCKNPAASGNSNTSSIDYSHGADPTP